MKERTEIIYTKHKFLDARNLRLSEGKRTEIIYIKRHLLATRDLPERIFFQYGIQTVPRHSL
jgi:hypothetical protein